MLEFAERVLREIRKLETDTEALVERTVSDMERYRFLMGRLKVFASLKRPFVTVKKYSDD